MKDWCSQNQSLLGSCTGVRSNLQEAAMPRGKSTGKDAILLYLIGKSVFLYLRGNFCCTYTYFIWQDVVLLYLLGSFLWECFAAVPFRKLCCCTDKLHVLLYLTESCTAIPVRKLCCCTDKSPQNWTSSLSRSIAWAARGPECGVSQHMILIAWRGFTPPWKGMIGANSPWKYLLYTVQYIYSIVTDTHSTALCV